MKNKRKIKMLAALTLAATLGSAEAATALVDFGFGAMAAGAPYVSASVAGGTTGSVSLTDTSGASTGWSVTASNSGSGVAGNAGSGANVSSFPAGLATFDTDALRNSIFANHGGPGLTNPAITVEFAGLTPGSTYDLVLYGSRAAGQGVNQRWSLTEGTGGADVDQFSELNSTVFVDWSSISPNASGVIEVTINSPGPDTTGALAVNFASISENAIPEPTGVTLLGLGLGTLFLRRKRA